MKKKLFFLSLIACISLNSLKAISPFILTPVQCNSSNGDISNEANVSVAYIPPCVSADITSLSLSASSVCLGSSSTITVNGNLNDAALWYLYINGCGTTAIDSNATGIFNVTPSVNTTYYIRGEGGCAAIGACANTTLLISANDDASFSYTSTVYCQNDVNPTPTITGTPGGAFTSTEGIILNPLTGEIDLFNSSGDTYSIIYTTNGPNCIVSSFQNITINSAYLVSQTASICNGQSYILGPQTLTTTGNYSQGYTSISGCDSTINLSLTVNNATTYTQDITLCVGGSFIVGTNTYSTSGTYTDVLDNSNSCDSTVTTNLTVLTAITSSQTLTICAGASLSVGSFTHTTSGTYIDVLTSYLGCDSTVTTDLTVLPAITTAQTLALCSGGSVTVGANTYFTSGVYTDVLPAANACDSTIVTDLTIFPDNTTTQNFTLCNGGNVTVGTNTYSISGTYTDILTGANTCDSTVTTNLTILSPIATSQTITLCTGGTLTVGSNTYSTSGTYLDNLTSYLGCDSAVTTNLTILSAIASSQTLVLCAGTSANVGGNIHNTSGTYTDVLASYTGCDSTVTTDLTILPDNTTSQLFTICSGSSVTVGSSTYTSSGIFTDDLVAFDGCDSTVTTFLTVNSADITNDFYTLCEGSTVTVGSHTYSITGVYTDIFTGANTCDSIIVTDLTIIPSVTNSQNITLCFGLTYSVGIHNYAASGTYIDTLTAYSGCDSIITTNLTISPQITGSQTFTLCAGGTVTVGTSTYNSSGIFTDVLTAANGCDSTVTTNLTILPAISTSQTFTLCPGGSVSVGPHTYSTSGTYTDVLSAANTCDSTVVTHLTILSNNSITQNFTLCNGGSITVGTNTYSTSGTYTDVFTGSNTCDSTVTTHLVMVSPISTSQTLILCNGGTVTVGSNTYNATGIYIDHLTSYLGCDSTVTTDLSILGPVAQSQTLVLCAGTSISIGGNVHSTTGIYTDVLESYSGCDSTVTTDLTILPANTSSQTFTICSGSSVTVGSSTYSTSGIYTDNLTAFNGCDSTVTTFLTVLAANTTVNNYTLCEGSTVTVGSNTYSTSGVYTDVYVGANTCDSTIVTNLTIIPTINNTQNITVCFGLDYTIGIHNYTASGIYVDTLAAYSGCDSIVNTNLTILPQIASTQAFTICAGSTVTVGTSIHSTSGTFTDILPAMNGCDSTVTTNLTVNPAVARTQTLTICAGTSTTVGTSTYSSTGTFTDNFVNGSGCDSIVTTHLTVLPAITNSQTFTVCSGGGVTVGSVTHTISGTFTDVLTAFNTCDSTVTTHLTVLPNSTFTQTPTICSGNSISVGSFTHNSSGTYIDVLVNSASNGCDSTVTTLLTVLPVLTGTQSPTVCFGGSITVGTSTYSTNGTFTDVITSANGCDSTVTTNLTVSPAITGSQTLTVCFSGSVTVGSSTHTTTGTFTDILTAHSGCDSTVTTNLTVSPSISTAQSFTVCAGGSVTVGSATHSTSGTFTDILTAHNGCDSTVTTTLTVSPAITLAQSFTVCAGGSVTVGTSTYTTSGTFTDIFTAYNGCDSTVTTNLTVSNVIAVTQTLTVCPGGSISVGTSTYNTSGTYTDVLTSHSGCDSTVTTNLTVSSAITGTQTLTVCFGGSVTVGTNTHTTTGTFTDVITAHSGCDSTVTTNLTISPAIAGTQTLSVCFGGSVIVGTATHTTTGTFTDILTAHNGCDSTVTTNLTVHPAITGSQLFTICAGANVHVGTSTYTTSGTYLDVLIAHNGCDSTVTTGLTVRPAITGSQTITVCAGGSVTVGTVTHNTSGTFTDILTAHDGCDSTVTTNLTVNPAFANSQTITICAGASLNVGTHTYSTSGTYTDILTAHNGCDSTVTTNLTVRAVITGTQTLTLCHGGFVIVGTSFHNTSGTFTDVLTAQSGCDSTVTSNITVNAAIATTQTITVCSGGSVTVGTNTYTVDGNYNDILMSATGCDSTVATNLTVSAPIISSQQITICPGSSYTVGTSTYNTTGSYADVFTAASGCDSTMLTTLIVSNSITNAQTITLCAGGSITVGSNTYNTSGTYTNILTAASGCDSTLTTNLTVSPAITATNAVTICAATSLTIGTNTYNTTGTYTNVLTATNGCDSTLTTTLTVSAAITGSQTYVLCHGGSVFVGSSQYSATGIYTDTLTAHNGCDSTVTTNLTVNASPIVTMTAFPNVICAEDAPFTLTNGSPAGGVYSGIGVVASPIFTPLSSGIGMFVITYTYTNSANGCSASDTASIKVKTCAGVDEYSFAESLNVYPNPSNGMFTISIGNATFDALFITVYDIQGREVYNETDRNISPDYNKQISMENVAKGLYYLRLSDGTNAKVQKIIIQ